MLITLNDPFTNNPVTLDLDVNAEDLDDWKSGRKTLDEATPNLPNYERYFLLTGVTPESNEKWEHSYNEVPEGMEVSMDKEYTYTPISASERKVLNLRDKVDLLQERLDFSENELRVASNHLKAARATIAQMCSAANKYYSKV